MHEEWTLNVQFVRGSRMLPAEADTAARNRATGRARVSTQRCTVRMPRVEHSGPPHRAPRSQASVQGAAANDGELPGLAAAPVRTRWLLWAQRQHTRVWHQPWLNLVRVQ